jgi:hypothetical protein
MTVPAVDLFVYLASNFAGAANSSTFGHDDQGEQGA